MAHYEMIMLSISTAMMVIAAVELLVMITLSLDRRNHG